MEQKFKKGDLCKVRTNPNQLVMVVEYKINRGGAVMNYFKGGSDYPDEVITDDVLCEWMEKRDVIRRYIKEANLELVTPAVEQ
jgi:hypothetical protein